MNKNNNIIKISGSPEGFDADLIIKEVNSGKTVIHVCRDDKRLLETKQALQFYNAGFEILEFPAWDCLPYDRVSPSLTIVSKRISTLSKLTREEANPFVVLTTVAAITQKTQSIKIAKQTQIISALRSQLHHAKAKAEDAQMALAASNVRIAQLNAILEGNDLNQQNNDKLNGKCFVYIITIYIYIYLINKYICIIFR